MLTLPGAFPALVISWWRTFSAHSKMGELACPFFLTKPLPLLVFLPNLLRMLVLQHSTGRKALQDRLSEHTCWRGAGADVRAWYPERR